MAGQHAQNFENHARYIPAYHGVTFGIFVINLLWSLYRVATQRSFDSLIGLLLAFGFLLLFFYARLFALTVQDRVIRLEMRLRLGQVLPADVRAKIGDLTVDQLVALRFASDEELENLVRKVLAENLTDRKAIKQLITNWQADYLRV